MTTEPAPEPEHGCEITKRGDGGYRVFCRPCGWSVVVYGLGAAEHATDEHIWSTAGTSRSPRTRN